MPNKCPTCKERFKKASKLSKHCESTGHPKPGWLKAKELRDKEAAQDAAWASRDNQDGPDWTSECEVCGQSPTVPETGMCGPCTFGEADTIGGNW